MSSVRTLAVSLLVVAIVLSTTGELFLKMGMTAIGGIRFDASGLVKAFTQWQVLVGFFLFFAGALVWLKVISLAELSWAYPMLALGYPIVVFASVFALGEALNLQRVLGSLLILCGVFVMYHSWAPR